MEEDPLKSLTEGATKGILDWTEQKVKDFVKKFQDRKLAFIKNPDNIELVKEERRSSEFSILKQFVPKGTKYSIQIQMGLALRQISDDQDRAIELVDRIRRKYGLSGLHVAEITQIGITSQLLTHLVELYRDPQEVTKRLVYFLDHIEDLVIFVKKDHNASAMARVILTRIESFTAHLMILFGSGYARVTLEEILTEIEKDPRKYVIEIRKEYLQTTAFMFTPELKKKITHWSDSIYPKTES